MTNLTNLVTRLEQLIYEQSEYIDTFSLTSQRRLLGVLNDTIMMIALFKSLPVDQWINHLISIRTISVIFSPRRKADDDEVAKIRQRLGDFTRVYHELCNSLV